MPSDPQADEERDTIARDVEDRINDGLAALFEGVASKQLAARQKYRPLVRNLTDIEFAGLWEEVVAERDHRLARLVRGVVR